MRLVIDSNRLFAALLKDATTRRLLISKSFKFYAPEELKQEFEKHREELLKKSNINEFSFNFVTTFLLQKIEFISLDSYPQAEKKANILMKEIDPKDSSFLAVGLALKLTGIWTEDVHFTKQSILPVYTNKLLSEIYHQN
jgi:predicted nucleic acid-binding protein